MGRRDVSVTVLLENTAPSGFEAEHGFSALVETPAGAVLFDAGASELFAVNARRLGKDLSRVSAVVLSHGHHDHAGGLPTACRIAESVPVYLHESALAGKYSRREGELAYAGVPENLATECRDRLWYAEAGDSPLAGTQLIAARGQRFPIPAGNETLFVKRHGEIVSDEFDDELSLAVEAGEGLILVTGCSHRGIANIVDACEAGFANRRLEGVIGGFHTKKDSLDVLAEVAERLSGIPQIYAGHCTGDDAFRFLRSRLGGAIRPCPVGTTVFL